MSKVLIAYASKYGCTEECAKALADKLNDGADLWNLKDKKQFDLDAYEKIIIGGSIYAGRIQKEIKDLCTRNESVLKNKTLGLFICGMSEGDEAKKQLDLSFPQTLTDSAVAKDRFGGKILMNNISFIERKIVKMVAKIESDLINVSESRIDQFAQKINEA